MRVEMRMFRVLLWAVVAMLIAAAILDWAILCARLSRFD